MYLPSIFEDNFVDDLFNDMFTFPFESERQTANCMSTDVKDAGDHYQMDIELPGYEKENIHAALNNGYLTITAQKHEDKNENDSNSRYVRQERYTGQCERSFYVGDGIKESDIHAGFKDGILRLVFPKEAAQKKVDQNRYIAIE